MNRISALVACILVAAALLIVGHTITSQAAVNDTPVCGNITTNTTWNLAGSPYVVCVGGVNVQSGVVLTIEPGVTVQFQAGARLADYGSLIALGTATQPITFTSVAATPGSWVGIYTYGSLSTPALVNLDHVTLEYGGFSSTSSGQLYAEYATITMTHSLVRSSPGSGFYAGTTVRLNVQDTHFANNAYNAVRMIQPVSGFTLRNLSASGNGSDTVYVGGTTYLTGDRHWPNPGLPYIIDAVLGNFVGDSLTIDPGNELQFTSFGYLNIGGDFKAIGLPGEPITMTGQVKTPGSWKGLVVYGGQEPSNAQLDYAAVEYGGSGVNGANISVNYGYLIARNSIIRNSIYDGVYFGSGGRGSILNSQISGNGASNSNSRGVRNITPVRSILATNNWWGHPSGPTTVDSTCSPGTGDRVTSGVLFRPVLTDTNITAPFPLSDAATLTLTPRRWFAPADGISRIYFDITLRDGSGAPLPGRIVRLVSSSGTVTDGGITDASGHTLAYMISNVPGDAEVIAALDPISACEGALSPSSKVTFTTPVSITDLFPDSPAPYIDGNLTVSPLPVVVGVPTTITARLKNPLSVPITVDVSFGYVQSGVGLQFGPIKDIVGQVIPADSSVILTATFQPFPAGHYCVEVTYNITAVGSVTGLSPQDGGSGRKQYNLDSYPGPMGSPRDKDILNRADRSMNLVGKMAPRGTNIQMGILSRWWSWAKEVTGISMQNLGSDPPRQDYRQATLPERHPWPDTQPGGNISPARAAAMNAASAALTDVLAYGSAAVVALDRYAGASEAQDMAWASQQVNSQLYYESQMATALATYADALDAFVQVLVSEGETNIHITSSDVIAYQQSLAAQGFTAQEIIDAHLVGLTDAQIETYRQEIIAANPNDLAGNVVDFYTNEAAISRELASALLTPDNFGAAVGGSPGLLATTAAGNTMVQINNTTATIQVGNPLLQQETIDLRIRRIDLPADWTATVFPDEVTLDPGQQITATVTVLTGSSLPQGTIPRVAVEGYAGSQLIGGVAIDIVAPKYVLFDGLTRVYAPLLRR